MRNSLAVAVLCTMLAPAAAAHTQDAAHGHTFLQGVLHPLTGFDHALAMVAIGIFAFMRGGPALWALPLAFVGGMTAGILSPVEHGAAPFIEIAIASSLLIVGALLAFQARLPLWLAIGLVVMAGGAHGAAHSLEGSAVQFTQFAGGALATTTLLHLVGACVGLTLKRARLAAQPVLGAAVALAGVAFLLTG
jgi:urease accessory protein